MTFSVGRDLKSASDYSLALSVDSFEERETTPADDKERILRLEVAFAWIKEGVQSLRDSDRIICEELERIRAAVDDIQDVQLQEEKKRLDYSFYDNSPFSLQATDDNDMNQKLFEEYFGCLFTDVEGTTRKRAAAEVSEDEGISDRLFSEYFGCLFTHDQQKRHRNQERHPLHVVNFDPGRNYSQTLV